MQNLTKNPRLFVDMNDVDRRENVVRTFHQAKKHGRHPVLRQEAPWEKNPGMTASVIYDDEEELFKVWYMAGFYAPGKEHVQCYAISRDGIHWDRPELGLHEALGNRENNIVIPAEYHDGQDHWESMVKDPFDPDEERRYKAIGWSSYDWDGPFSGIYSAYSPDGLTWSHSPEPVFHHHPRPNSRDYGPIGDAQSLMIDERQRRYVAFLRDGMYRSMSVSEDFVHWTPPRRFLQIQNEEEQLYNNTGFVYGDQYLGFLTHFDRRPLQQTQVLRLLSSRDGETWMRTPGDPLIPTGDIDAWDRFQIMLTGGPPIPVGDRMHIYYRGTPRRHNKVVGEFEPRIDPDQERNVMAIGLATLRLDGFASIAASFDGGTITTVPFELDGERLLVNLTSDHGASKVELLNEEFQPLKGYTHDECVSITTDNVATQVVWKERRTVGELRGKAVRLKFYLKNARLYSFRCLS